MGDDNSVTRFALLRHAKTEWNLKKRIQGQTDSPLTGEGENQAREWGRILKRLEWDLIITSDTGRARETASLINLSLDVQVIHDSRLREQDWGLWTGKTLTQVKKEEPRLLEEQERSGWKFTPPGGEIREDVLKRSISALSDANNKWRGEKILVVTHEGVIKSIISHLREIKQPTLQNTPLLSNHIHCLIYSHEGLSLEKVNALSLP